MNIIEPDNNFNFSQLSLGQPTSIPGGAYFTKIEYFNKPLYIQTPRFSSKQGFVKNGKKISCDLMFDNTNENFISWIENLETECQKLIYGKSNEWFQSPLELNDIETAFNNPLKLYKSGKYYLLRTNVKMNSYSNTPIIKIYNENEDILTIDDVTCDTNIICIVEVQGIKFTTRNFQLEFEIKQAMVLNNETIFESCLIKKSGTQSHTVVADKQDASLEEEQEEQEEQEQELPSQNKLSEKDLSSDLELISDSIIESLENEQHSNIGIISDDDIVSATLEPSLNNSQQEQPDTNIQLNIVDLGTDKEEFKEIEFNVNDSQLETIKLKNPTEVYLQIYKAAKQKAKEAKRTAILAYLEAKNIKRSYMLEDTNDSDDSSLDSADYNSDDSYMEENTP
jgi:hypothetical protein